MRGHFIQPGKQRLRGRVKRTVHGHLANDRAEFYFSTLWAPLAASLGLRQSETQRWLDESGGCGLAFLSSSGREELGQEGCRIQELVGESPALAGGFCAVTQGRGRETCSLELLFVLLIE